MLLRHRGRVGGTVKHRFFRVLLPLLLGMVTIVPATTWISAVAMSSASRKPGGASPIGKESDIWAAAEAGDLGAIERHLANGAAVNGSGGKFDSTPLQRAAVAGRAEAIELLIRRGADVNIGDRARSTPLHAAAFLGHEETVHALVQNGADVNATNARGQTPLGVATIDEGTTRVVASLLEIKLDEEGLGSRKAAIAEYLRRRGATAGKTEGVADLLMQMPLFNHLWFLWFLWWLVLGLAAVSALGARLPSIRMTAWLVLSPARYLWPESPLTMIPQWFTGNRGGGQLACPFRAGWLLRPAADPARPGVLRNLLRLRGALFRVRRPVRSRRRALVAAAFARTPGRFPAGDGPHGGVARTSGRQARLAAAPGPCRFLAGGLPLAHDVRPHGVVPAVLPGREPDDALPVGLGLLALPCPSAADHRGPVRGAGLALAGPREVPVHRRGRDLLPFCGRIRTWCATPGWGAS